MARVLFITGFNRSGTTLVTAAATEAARAATLTVGHLARHLPSLDRFLAASRDGAVRDRGVDRLPVEASTPEEYGWLLRARTGEFAFGPAAAESGILRTLVDEIADADGAETVVLKNPWDTGRERLLLDHFPDARVLLVRRRLGAIEESLHRAWSRMATSSRYARSLFHDRRDAAEFTGLLRNPQAREEMVRTSRRRMRLDVLNLVRGVSRLPLDRVALISYDELRADPRAGAAWAAHLLDAEAFAGAVESTTFPEYNQARPSSPVVRGLDALWARAWRRIRDRQVRAGILPAPGGEVR